MELLVKCFNTQSTPQKLREIFLCITVHNTLLALFLSYFLEVALNERWIPHAPPNMEATLYPK